MENGTETLDRDLRANRAFSALTPEFAAHARLRLGELLVTSGQISRAQLDAALARKCRTGRKLGEELVAAGEISKDLVTRALALQRRFAFAASLAALSPVNPTTVGHVSAGEARTYMQVSATVVDAVSIRAVHQTRNLTVTPQDVERGYVEVRGGSRFEIRNARPCLFEFRPLGENIFRSVRVTGVHGMAEFGPDGGTLLQTGLSDRATTVDVAYRFQLVPGVQPGAYPWPLALTVMPL